MRKAFSFSLQNIRLACKKAALESGSKYEYRYLPFNSLDLRGMAGLVDALIAEGWNYKGVDVTTTDDYMEMYFCREVPFTEEERARLKADIEELEQLLNIKEDHSGKD